MPPSEPLSGVVDVRKWRDWAREGYSGDVTVGHDLQRIILATR